MTLQRARSVSAPWVSATHLVGCQVDCWSNPRRSGSRSGFSACFLRQNWTTQKKEPRSSSSRAFKLTARTANGTVDETHPEKTPVFWLVVCNSISYKGYRVFFAPSPGGCGMGILNHLYNCEVPWWQTAPQRYSTALASLGERGATQVWMKWPGVYQVGTNVYKCFTW